MKERFHIDYKYQVEIDKIQENEWSALILEFEDATIYQTWPIKLAMDQGELSHLVVFRDGSAIGMCQVQIRAIPVLDSKIAFIHFGPLWKRKGIREDLGVFHLVCHEAKKEYVDNRGYFLRIWPNIHEDSDDEVSLILSEIGFKHERWVPKYQTLVLDLEPSLEELRANLIQKWRNRLNKSLKSDVTITEGKDVRMFDTFLLLFNEMHQRKKFDTRINYVRYRDVQQELRDESKMLIVNCIHEDHPVSSLIVSALGNTGIYLFGATVHMGLKLNSSYLLQWRIIEWLKENGFRYYDLGGIDIENNPHVYHFKRGIAGKNGKHVTYLGEYYVYKSFKSWLVYKLFNTMRFSKRLYRRIQNTLGLH